jgi:drug/metabolite transporter (DMT)-like permease
MILWGAAWVAVKILVEFAAPYTIGFFRYLIAGLFFIVLIHATGGSSRNLFTRDNFKLVFVSGAIGIFGFSILSLIGTRYTTAAQASIIAGINPITVSLFAHIIQKEKLPNRWQYIGFIASFSGIFFIVGIQAAIDFQLDYLVGNLILIIAMFTWGLYSSISKIAMKTMTALELTASTVLVGALIFGIGTISEISLLSSTLTNPMFWISILFLSGVVTFLGFLWYIEAIDKIGLTKSGVFVSLVPVFGTTLAIFLLQEPFNLTFLIGLILVVVGILIINKPESENQ